MPVQVPLREVGLRALHRGVRRVQRRERVRLVILHVNLRHRGRSITSTHLQAAVEQTAGPLDATYVVRDGYLLEDEILAEAAMQHADTIVVGYTPTPRWRRILRRLTGASGDIGRALRHHNPDIDIVEVNP